MNDEKMAYLQQSTERLAGQGTEMLLALQVVAGFSSIHHALVGAGRAEEADIVDDLSRLVVSISGIPREVWQRATSEYRKMMDGARMLDDGPTPPSAGGVQ